MKKDRNMDELVRDKLLNFEQEPPAYLLANILAGAASARRKRKIAFWRIAGVAAALLLAFVAGWQFDANEESKFNNLSVISQNSTSETETGKIIPSEIKHADKESIINSGQPDSKLMVSESKQKVNRENAPGFKRLNPDATAESHFIAANDESLYLNPIRSLYHLLNHNTELTKSLQIRKAADKSVKSAEKSIDQQIMEQNKEILLAQNEKMEKSRWLVGAQVSPAYSVNRSNQTDQYASNMLKSSTGSPVELGGGISVEYKTGKRWSLQAVFIIPDWGKLQEIHPDPAEKSICMPTLVPDILIHQ